MKKIYRIAWLSGAILAVGGGAYGLADYLGALPLAFSPAQNQETAAGAPKPPVNARAVSVLVDRVRRADIPIEIVAVGSVQASQSVSVRSRIDSAILQIHFSEGDEVKAGDALFSLDARAIEAQIRQAEANLARDRVTLSNATRDANRYQSLARSDFVARQKLDDAMALVQSAENTVKANEANVEGLKVQLSYTRILAPIDGRTGRINLTKGNIARANEAAPLVVINQIKPVNLIFAVPQRYFPQLRAAIAARGVTLTAEAPGKGQLEGAVDFLDNSIDSSSGTFRVKARFANPDGALWPGMFVPVTVRLGVEAGALIVPSQTVQSGQQASYLYVVKPDNQVELRPVTVLCYAGERAVIGSGVQEGEMVVVEGQMRLFPGARIEPRTPPVRASWPQSRQAP